MTGISQREAIKKAYPTKAWAQKVDKMPSGQVTAIYLRMKKDGKI